MDVYAITACCSEKAGKKGWARAYKVCWAVKRRRSQYTTSRPKATSSLAANVVVLTPENCKVSGSLMSGQSYLDSASNC